MMIPEADAKKDFQKASVPYPMFNTAFPIEDRT